MVFLIFGYGCANIGPNSLFKLLKSCTEQSTFIHDIVLVGLYNNKIRITTVFLP